MIIDIHTHAFPDKISLKARASLEATFGVTLVSNPTITALLSYMDKNKIDISVVCGVASRPDQVTSINDWLFSVRSKRIKVFCAMHPDYENWENELKRIKEQGDGIKLQPEAQAFYIDDKKNFELYEKMQYLDIPVLFHCGRELSGTALIHSSPERMLTLIKNFPTLKIIAAHFGGFQVWDEVEEYLLGKDIYFDTAFFFNYLAPEKIKILLSRHPANRLLFGTDFPLVDQKNDLAAIKQLNLPKATEEQLLYLNASRLLTI